MGLRHDPTFAKNTLGVSSKFLFNPGTQTVPIGTECSFSTPVLIVNYTEIYEIHID